MLYITQNSDRHSQTSVNLKANHPTLLRLFTKSHACFYLTELKLTYVYLFNKLLTNSYPKAFCTLAVLLCNSLYPRYC
jgi:hypothetical protein